MQRGVFSVGTEQGRSVYEFPSPFSMYESILSQASARLRGIHYLVKLLVLKAQKPAALYSESVL